MVPVDKCFECGEKVFVASYHLEPGKEWPGKYPIYFCDETCRTAFLRHVLEIVTDEL